MIHLLLVDDHAVVREGVKRMLASTPDIVVEGEANNASEASAALAAGIFDMVVLDISLPGGSGLEVLRQLRDTHPTLPVLIFSVHPERQYVVRALKMGATGYLLKSSAPEELVTAMRKIAQGERYVSAALVEHLVDEIAEPDRPLYLTLTPREEQVLHLMAGGSAMKEIAYALSLSVKTVSTYRTRLLKKLHLQTTADLIRYAIQHRLVE